MQPAQNISSAVRIGGHTLASRAVLAPLSGVTDVHFRRIAARFGAGLVVSEMVASDAYLRGEEEARLRAEGKGIAPHVVQLAGCEPNSMGEAARLAQASGAAIIDINMGCPAKRVVGGYAGSALMRDLDLAARIVAAVAAACTVPFTVKMRLGWDPGRLNAAELARRAEALGAAAVTVHGRTRQQFYTGAADWAAIAPVVGAVRIPVIANGDIGSLPDAKRCLDLSGASAVMVGRASLGRPWLPAEIGAGLDGRTWREPDPAQKLALALEHYDGLLRSLGVRAGVRHARKHLAAYAQEAGRAGHLLRPADRTELVTTDEPVVVHAILGRIFEAPLREAA